MTRRNVRKKTKKNISRKNKNTGGAPILMQIGPTCQSYATARVITRILKHLGIIEKYESVNDDLYKQMTENVNPSCKHGEDISRSDFFRLYKENESNNENKKIMDIFIKELNYFRIALVGSYLRYLTISKTTNGTFFFDIFKIIETQELTDEEIKQKIIGFYNTCNLRYNYTNEEVKEENDYEKIKGHVVKEFNNIISRIKDKNSRNNTKITIKIFDVPPYKPYNYKENSEIVYTLGFSDNLNVKHIVLVNKIVYNDNTYTFEIKDSNFLEPYNLTLELKENTLTYHSSSTSFKETYIGNTNNILVYRFYEYKLRHLICKLCIDGGIKKNTVIRSNLNNETIFEFPIGNDITFGDLKLNGINLSEAESGELEKEVKIRIKRLNDKHEETLKNNIILPSSNNKSSNKQSSNTSFSSNNKTNDSFYPERITIDSVNKYFKNIDPKYFNYKAVNLFIHSLHNPKNRTNIKNTIKKFIDNLIKFN